MKEYEVYLEEMTPCGGEKYARKEFLEVVAESPEAYVKAYGKWPILDITTAANGDTVVLTGDCAGNRIRYTFS